MFDAEVDAVSVYSLRLKSTEMDLRLKLFMTTSAAWQAELLLAPQTWPALEPAVFLKWVCSVLPKVVTPTSDTTKFALCVPLCESVWPPLGEVGVPLVGVGAGVVPEPEVGARVPPGSEGQTLGVGTPADVGTPAVDGEPPIDVGAPQDLHGGATGVKEVGAFLKQAFW